MSTTQEAIDAALQDINLLRWLVEADENQIDEILKTKPDPPLLLSKEDLKEFIDNLLHGKREFTAKELVLYYNSLELKIRKTPQPPPPEPAGEGFRNRGTTPPPGWRL